MQERVLSDQLLEKLPMHQVRIHGLSSAFDGGFRITPSRLGGSGFGSRGGGVDGRLAAGVAGSGVCRCCGCSLEARVRTQHAVAEHVGEKRRARLGDVQSRVRVMSLVLQVQRIKGALNVGPQLPVLLSVSLPPVASAKKQLL